MYYRAIRGLFLAAHGLSMSYKWWSVPQPPHTREASPPKVANIGLGRVNLNGSATPIAQLAAPAMEIHESPSRGAGTASASFIKVGAVPRCQDVC